MKKGYVRITRQCLEQALKFPADWKILNIRQSYSEHGHKLIGEYTMLISGSDFPETNNRGYAESVELVYHKETYRIEVKRIEEPA